MKYAHTNIVANDWKCLADFYCAVFSCVPVPPQRQQSGNWLDLGTGLSNADINGMHLRLPGHGDNGPTLEIYQYNHVEPTSGPMPNRKGLGHLAFEVDDVESTTEKVLLHGGSWIGKIAETKIKDVGKLTFVYMADPEGNILEVQNWD